MKNLDKVLEVLGEKIKDLELTIFCKDREIESLKKELEAKELKKNE